MGAGPWHPYRGSKDGWAEELVGMLSEGFDHLRPIYVMSDSVYVLSGMDFLGTAYFGVMLLIYSR
jgi:hypothetical protein